MMTDVKGEMEIMSCRQTCWRMNGKMRALVPLSRIY